MFHELERSTRIAPGRFLRIGTGEYMDSLALEHLTGFVEPGFLDDAWVCKPDLAGVHFAPREGNGPALLHRHDDRSQSHRGRIEDSEFPLFTDRRVR